MKATVYHQYYGCDCECCGHLIELRYPDGTLREAFDFDHWDGEGDPIEYARRLVTREFGEEHAGDLDWENCKVESFKGCFL